jgi:hypothetical protein
MLFSHSINKLVPAAMTVVMAVPAMAMMMVPVADIDNHLCSRCRYQRC